jgi:hypothetical protein
MKELIKVVNSKGESHLIEESQLAHFGKHGFVKEVKKAK